MYREERPLGQGAQGSAVLVRRPDGRRFVAKVYPTEAMDPRSRSLALREVRLLRSLRHPCVAHAVDSEERPDGLWLILTWYREGDLAGWIARAKAKQEPFGEPQVLSWVAQLGEALAFVHEKGIVHRDVKPSNVFVTSSFNVCLGDFGVCVEVWAPLPHAKLERASALAGSPPYMAP